MKCKHFLWFLGLLVAMPGWGAGFVDYRSLNGSDFTTNVPSPFYVGVNTNKFPPLSAFDQQFFSTNGYLLTLKTNSGSALSNYVFSIVNNQGTVIAAGTNITTVTNGRLVTISVTSTNLPGVAAGTNVLLTTNGLTTTVNGLTDTNNVNTLISTRIGPGTNNYMAKFFNRTNVTTGSLLNVASNMVSLMSRQDGNSFTNGATNEVVGEWTDANNWESFQMVIGPNANSYYELHGVQGSGRTQGLKPIKIADWLGIEPVNPTSGHSAYSLYPLVDNVSVWGSSSLRIKGITFGTGNIDIGLSAIHPTIRGGGGSGAYGLDFNAKSLAIWTDFGGGASAGWNQFDGKFYLDQGANALGFGVGYSNISSTITGGGDVVIQTIQIGTNSAVASPTAVGIMGARGTTTDHGGSDLKLMGGPSTGTGKPGDLRIQTLEPAASTSASINTAFKDRFIVASRPVTLTESAATLVFNVALASGKFCGMRVMATTDADDGTDFQTITETIAIAAINKAGTVTTAVSASGLPATVTSTGTLTTTWTAVANGNGIDVKCNAVSSLTQTTLKTRWRVDLDGDGTLVTTPQ